MNRYLLCVSALALMAAPAFAQEHEHGGGRPGGGGPHGGEAPAAAPAAPAAAPAAPAAPAAAPVAPAARGGNTPVTRGNFWQQGNRRDAAPQPAAAAPNPQQTPSAVGNGPGDRGNFRGNNSRPDDRRGFGPNNRPGFNDNRGGFNGPGNNRSGFGSNRGDRNFSGFRDFHRAISAPHRFRGPSYRQPPGFAYRRWSYGDILPSLFWSQQYWLSDYNTYDLPPPPYGAVWVRYGSDALLIDRDLGEIITVYYGVFY